MFANCCCNCRRYYVDREGSSLDREQLLYIIRDLLIAGTETTTTQILWTIVLLAATKEGREIQAKMRREIDSVVPRDRLPALDDKSSLPYVEACILEIMRFKTISPLGNMHETKCDTEVNGYFIPAGTMVS
jgi:cytochrome P450